MLFASSRRFSTTLTVSAVVSSSRSATAKGEKSAVAKVTVPAWVSIAALSVSSSAVSPRRWNRRGAAIVRMASARIVIVTGSSGCWAVSSSRKPISTRTMEATRFVSATASFVVSCSAAGSAPFFSGAGPSPSVSVLSLFCAGSVVSAAAAGSGVSVVSAVSAVGVGSMGSIPSMGSVFSVGFALSGTRLTSVRIAFSAASANV